MSSSKEVYESLNKVFDLMLDDKFCEDMDDSLLRKLLTVISRTFSTCDFPFINLPVRKKTRSEILRNIQEFIANTQALQFAEKAILSLRSSSIELPVSIQCFAIELIGLLFSCEDIFILYKDSTILKEFSTAVHKMSALNSPPSIQSAVLHCFTDLVQHPKGLLWLNDQDLIRFVSSCFTSYYINRITSAFFKRALFNWESSETTALSEEEQSTLNNILEKIVLDLIAMISCDNPDLEKCESVCISTLEACFKIPNVRRLIDNSSNLKVQLSNYFQCLTREQDVNQKILDFIPTLFSSDGVSEFLLRDILNSLLSHSFFASGITLMGLILSVPEKYAPIFTKHIQLLIMPLQILSGNISIREEDDIFTLPLNKVCNSMTKTMEVKSDCIKIIISSLLSLAQVTELMDPEALETMMVSIGIVATGPTSSHHHPMSYLCLKNRQICLALIELFTTILKEKVYPFLKLQNKLDLLNYLLCCIEKPCDCNICVEALKLLAHFITLNDNYCISLPDELKEKTANLLCMKLMDKSESIVMESLSVVEAIMKRDGNQFWKEIIFKKNIHRIVWEMGVDGIQADMLKATSLQTAFQVYKVPYFWEDIKSAKGIDEVDVLKILMYYFHVHRCYTQTESFSCLSELLAHDKVPESYLDSVLTILLKAMDYLDMYHKIEALDQWSELIKSSKYFPDAMHSVDNLLTTVCNSGFASALVLALEDFYPVQEKAAEILKNFQETLLQLGYVKDSLALDDVEVIIPAKENIDKNDDDDPVAEAERKAVLESIMNLSTAEQIARLAGPPNPPYSERSEEITSEVGKLSYPVNSFLKCVWSDKVNSILLGPNTCRDLFSDYARSLIDDIILSEDAKTESPKDDVPDCY